ncbi:MAG: helix-turn-helix domain-containing protein [Tannerella sp.]|jgi:AraC-like DNA-binding protein|nr:helix-turn-helix domain-containing protein [Tannerella sp.]
MENIFKVRELNACRKDVADVSAAFVYYEIEAGEEIGNHALPLHFIFFVLEGVMEVSYNQFENHRFETNEMLFLLRSSSVKVRTLKNVKLYVMYFDKLMSSSCDRQLFKTYLPYAEKSVYDFRPVAIPAPVRVFLEQTLYFQNLKVDCSHFNALKQHEFFLLLHYFCAREEVVALLSPMMGESMDFRNKVLESYPKVDGRSVTKFAGLVGMGRKTFDKRFREEFNTSPAKWMQQETAKRLRLYLSESGVTISDAMDKFYFNSPGHFNRFCHHYFHASPGAIAREVKASIRKKDKSQDMD